MKKVLSILLLWAAASAASAWCAIKPDSPSGLGAVFHLNDNDPYVTVTMTAPTKGTDTETYTPVELTEITFINVYRSSYDAGEFDVLIKRIDNPAPGETISFDDTDEVTIGCEYMYTARCTLKGVTSWSESTPYIYAGVKPAAPTVTLTTADRGKAPITVSIAVPNCDINGLPLEAPITSITLKRGANGSSNPATLRTFYNPVEGSTLTYTDRDAADGYTYIYTAAAITDYGTSDAGTQSIFVGEDVPTAPTGLTLAGDGNGGVNISWEAPAGSLRGGWIDPADTRYTVERRHYNSSGAVTVAEKIAETSFHDPCDDFDAETLITYRVYASNSQGGTASVIDTDGIIVGPPTALPYYESFHGGTGFYGGAPVNLWTTEATDGNSFWDFSNGFDWEYHIEGYRCRDADSATGQEAVDDGFAYTYFSSYSDDAKTDCLISGRIDLGAATNPVASFYYVPLTTQCSFALEVIKASGERVTIREFDLNKGAPDSDNYKWQRAIVALDELKGTEGPLKLCFRASSAPTRKGNTSLFLDEVTVDDYPAPTGLSAKFGENGTTTLTWTDPSTSFRKVDFYTFYLDGAQSNAIIEQPTLDLDLTPGESHVINLTATYEGGIQSPLSEDFKIDVPLPAGIDAVDAGAGETEYFNLQGIKTDRPAKGEIAIKRTIAADGSVKIEKILQQ